MSKTKFSYKTKDPNFVRSSFRFHITEAPGCTLTIRDERRKVAIARAMKEAPGCTFNKIEELKP